MPSYPFTVVEAPKPHTTVVSAAYEVAANLKVTAESVHDNTSKQKASSTDDE